MRSLQRAFLYLAILLLPFQDVLLGRSALGFAGANISFVPFTLYGIMGVLLWLRDDRPALSRSWLLWGGYALVLSILYILVWGPVSHQTSVIYKTFSMGFLCLLTAYVVLRVDYEPTRGLKYCTYIALLLTLLGVVTCDLNLPGISQIANSPLFHITGDEGQGRFRGFSSEPSNFGATVVCLGLLSARYMKSGLARFLILGGTVVLMYFSGSKGGLIVLSASCCVLIPLLKPGKVLSVVYGVLGLGAIAAAVYVAFQQVSAVDLGTASGTFATRISLQVWVLIVLLHHPWGVGFSGFYEAITHYLPQAIAQVDAASPVPLNFHEVERYVYGVGEPLDAKSFMWEYAVNFGVLFPAAYVRWIWKVLRVLLAKRETILSVAFVFVAFGLSTYLNALALYPVFYLLGVAYREVKLSRPGRVAAVQAL